MALKVVGAGFGRTGTMSLKFALEMLGVGPCYHMIEVFKNPGHARRWLEAMDSPNPDFSGLLAGYQSVVDWPTTYFWKELSDLNPEAKVILTERTPASWHKSCMDTIFQTLDAEPKTEEFAHQKVMAKEMVFERTFGGRWADFDHAQRVFVEHNEEVKRRISPERLLVYQVSEGWEPLCKFLGLPIPSEPFPRMNSTEEFKSRHIPPV